MGNHAAVVVRRRLEVDSALATQSCQLHHRVKIAGLDQRAVGWCSSADRRRCHRLHPGRPRSAEYRRKQRAESGGNRSVPKNRGCSFFPKFRRGLAGPNGRALSRDPHFSSFRFDQPAAVESRLDDASWASHSALTHFELSSVLSANPRSRNSLAPTALPLRASRYRRGTMAGGACPHGTFRCTHAPLS